MQFIYTRTVFRWGFRFEFTSLGQIIVFMVNLRKPAVRAALFGFGFHAGKIPYKVEKNCGEVQGAESLDATRGPLVLGLNVTSETAKQ